MAGGRLVNVGSLCVDNVYAVPNFAGAGETVASVSHAVHPGGKGLNQSLAAAKAGAAVAHFGCIGADGRWLKDVLQGAGVDVAGVREVAGASSGHAVIQVNRRGENAITIAGGANRRLTGADLDAAFARLGAADWLLLQNEINDIDGVLARARHSPARVAFNVAPVDGREQAYDLAGLDLMIVNEVEARALAGVAEPEAALKVLAERHPECDVALTLGREGLIHGRAGERSRQRPFTVQAVDETAAGDAFVGYLMAALIRGEAMRDALRWGAAAGALAVTQAGAASSIPQPEAVSALLGAQS